MKNLAFTFLLVLTCIALQAQDLKEVQVPVVVKDAFAKGHPGVMVEKWEKEKNNYEAEYTINGVEYSLLYDAAGNLLENEVKVPIGDLPQAATDYISKNYKTEKIKDVSKITDASGKIFYEADLGKKDLIFTEAGVFIKAEKDAEKE